MDDGQELEALSMVDLGAHLAAMAPSKDRVSACIVKLGKGGIQVPQRVPDPRAQAAQLPPHRRRQRSSFQDEPYPPAPRTTTMSDPQYRALITIDIEDVDMDGKEPRMLVDWLKRADPQLNIKVKDVFQSRSVVVLLLVPMRCWFLLDGLVGFGFTCPVKGQSMVERGEIEDVTRSLAGFGGVENKPPLLHGAKRA